MKLTIRLIIVALLIPLGVQARAGSGIDPNRLFTHAVRSNLLILDRATVRRREYPAYYNLGQFHVTGQPGYVRRHHTLRNRPLRRSRPSNPPPFFAPQCDNPVWNSRLHYLCRNIIPKPFAY